MLGFQIFSRHAYVVSKGVFSMFKMRSKRPLFEIRNAACLLVIDVSALQIANRVFRRFGLVGSWGCDTRPIPTMSGTPGTL